jgi:uncharacterized DUF497 family protein
MEFEWDDGNRKHIARHGVTEETDCETAMLNCISTISDPRGGEPRSESEGLVNKRRLIMIWTRREERIRIITAWWRGPRTRRRQ